LHKKRSTDSSIHSKYMHCVQLPEGHCKKNLVLFPEVQLSQVGALLKAVILQVLHNKIL
jgi:hypothetical protein